jgi:hypothetical protein
MKKIFLALLTVMFVSTGAAYAGEYKATGKAGDFDVTLTLDKNPPIVGNNNATIAVKDNSGQPVTDAAVRVEYGMPAMPGMPATNNLSDAKISEGAYKATLNLTPSGPSFINVKILKDKKVSIAKFSVDVQ